MQAAVKAAQAESEDDSDEDEAARASGASDDDQDSEDEERGIQDEIQKLRTKKLREQKRIKKKEREVMAKRRRRAALGMDLNAIDLPEQERMFSLGTISSKGGLEAAREVDLGMVTDDQIMIP